METTQAGGARRKLPMEAEKLEADSCAAYGMDVEMTVSDIMLKATKTIGRMEPGLKEKAETNEVFAKRLEAELQPELDMIWRMCVDYTSAGASAYEAGRQKWLDAFPGVPAGDGSARALIRKCATATAKVLLDVWAETTMGRKWDAFLKVTQLEKEAKVLEETIGLKQPEVVRAKVLAFLRAHETLYGTADTPAKARLAVTALLGKLDKSIAATAPGKVEAAEKLTISKEALADAVGDAADRAARAASETKTKTKVAAPTEEMREPRQEERAERPARNKGVCFACHKEGHFARDCRAGQKKASGRGKADKTEDCEACGLVGHFARRCPTQTCQGCGEKGHRRHDCPKGNKDAPSKYSSDEG